MVLTYSERSQLGLHIISDFFKSIVIMWFNITNGFKEMNKTAIIKYRFLLKMELIDV